MFTDKIVQVIKNGAEYQGPEQPTITTVDNVVDLIDAVNPYSFAEQPVVEKLLECPRFVMFLEGLGWVDAKKAQKEDEATTLGSNYYIHNTNPHSYMKPSLDVVDLTDMSEFDAAKLARDSTTLLCSVNVTSLKKVNPKAYKAYLASKKKIKEKGVKKKIAAAARAKKKKATAAQKKEAALVAARKLLKEAGE